MPLYNINMISRAEWGAKDAKGFIPEFVHPGMHVVLTLKTNFGECFTKEECIQKVQLIQKQHMEEWGLPDIAYNFLIGNDGNVYEGRGWNLKSAKGLGNPNFNGKTFDIGLIGDYTKIEPGESEMEIPDEMYYMSTSLLTYAVQFKYLYGDYTYKGHLVEDPPLLK